MKSPKIFESPYRPDWIIALICILAVKVVGVSLSFVQDNYKIVKKETVTLESELRDQTPSISTGFPVGAREAPCDSILESIPATDDGARCFWQPRSLDP